MPLMERSVRPLLSATLLWVSLPSALKLLLDLERS